MYTTCRLTGHSQVAMFKIVSPHQWTSLHLAAREGHLDEVKLLLNKGADIHTMNDNGVSD